MTNQYKALLPIAMLLITICLSTLPIGYQVVQIGPYIFSAVAIIIPFRYLMCDIISEVYGYNIAKKFIWIMLFCGFLFAIIVSTIIKLPAPVYWVHSGEYKFVLGGTFKIITYASLGMLVGSFINIFLVTKWRFLVKGQLFWLRSLGGSIIGEISQYIIGLTLMFHGFLGWQKVLELVIIDYLLQVIILCLFAPIAQVLMHKLKKFENIQSKEQIISLNPFKFTN